MAEADAATPPPSRLRDSVVAALIEAGATRIELAATELAEERLRVAQQATFIAVGVFLCAFGAALAVALVVLLTPPPLRPAVLGGIAAACLALGVFGLWRARAIARARPPLFGATLDVLRADAAALRSRDQPR